MKNPPDKNTEFSQQTDKIITEIIANSQFNALPNKIHQAVKLVRDGKRDYLSFINFSGLIKESPLPTQLITTYYSYASAFAHSEGFSSDVSQMVFESRENWSNLNELLKFRIMYFALAISSQFFHSFIDYDKTQLEDKKELEVCEVTSLTSYYLKALTYNS